MLYYSSFYKKLPPMAVGPAAAGPPPLGLMFFITLLQLAPAALMMQSGMQADRELAESLMQAQKEVESTSGEIAVGEATAPETISYLLKTLDMFNGYSAKANAKAEVRHHKEEKALEHLFEEATDEGVKLTLQQSITASKQSLLETSKIYKSMVGFSSTVAKLLRGTTSKGHGCESVRCGDHASCTTTTAGFECVCNEGYVGTGGQCRPPAEFLPHRLVLASTGGSTTRAADMNIAVFGSNNIAVVYRDVSKRHAGQIVVAGVREAGTADLAPPEQFTVPDGMAFGPIVTGTANKRIAVAWRDENRIGSCWVRGAVIGASGIRGADMAVTWGEKVNFCQDQAHGMAFVSLPNDNFAVLFPDKAKADRDAPRQSFGNSLLARINEQGGLEVRGKFRFTEHAVCRLAVTKITPTAFILAGRSAKAVDDLDATVTTQQEAMAMYGELIDNDLVFDPNPLNLEPKSKNIWARGISLIAPNTIAYTYQDGAGMNMKMAVLEVDPKTHRMQVLQEPTVIRQGFSPYVSMLSVPYTPSDPHTLTYYEDEVANTSMANLCSWNVRAKQLSRCEDFSWLNQRLSTVSGVHLGGGRSLFVFAAESGVPYYGIFGLSKK